MKRLRRIGPFGWIADRFRSPEERSRRARQAVDDTRLVAASFAFLDAPPGDEGREQRERSIDEMEIVRFGRVL